jgi:ComF family protein
LNSIKFYYNFEMEEFYLRAGILKTGFKFLLDTVFPTSCIGCSEPVSDPGNLCANCWPNMTFLSAPMCQICGYPFEYNAGDDLHCGNCIRRCPTYSSARSVLKYDEFSRDLVLGYKHTDQTSRAPAFATWMYRAARSQVDDCDFICAVPLHWKRLLARRYNQSALLANELAALSGKRSVPDLLFRKRNTRSQGGLSAMARQRNVQGVFQITKKRHQLVENARIVLIDDVLTTGATVEACSKSLFQAGAAQVDVLTFCRVVRASNPSI